MKEDKEVVEIIEEKENQKNKLKDFLIYVFDIIAFLVFVLGLVLLVRIFLFNPFTVVGHSMDPTFKEGDFIVVDKISPRFSDFERGDIIVFVPPQKDVNYIKRIIGMPGETIKLNDGYVYVCDGDGENCERLDEPYLENQGVTGPECNVDEFEVGSGGYFVLGDNRDQSTDSRCCFGLGCYDGTEYVLKDEDILGKVSLRIFPDFNRF
ncbi:signal peptidase I [Candidatus Absconditicoccus praedator]|uniref:signal peptidase I n=1 Tax=Candidatus Absconditicoccus praedator TaxID=2735562 RepID=UPI001E558818|nr:signal peptidase I [Candidatus Absconditicoccus praedator]UFX82819.1 signal peptidase I [Candidatus Absconditicoccus praedator]